MANDRPFCSSIGGYIQSFINVKRALGFQYKEHARCLYHFDRMVAESFPGNCNKRDLQGVDRT